MNRLDIFCFTSIARTKSFSATARELRISQQAVSKHIRNLETELGYPLFFRDRTFLELTKAGVYLLDYLSERAQILKGIQTEFLSGDTSGTLNIGCSQWVGSPGWFHDAVRRFHGERKDLEIHMQDLDAPEAVQAIRENRIDVFLASRYMARHIPSQWDSLVVRKQPLYLIGDRHFSLKDEQREFFPFYVSSAGEENENAIRLQVLKTCGKLGFVPRDIICCPDMGTVMLNIILNGGITLGSYPPERGNIRDFSCWDTGLQAEILICLPYISRNPYARQFAGYLQKKEGNAYE